MGGTQATYYIAPWVHHEHQEGLVLGKVGGKVGGTQATYYIAPWVPTTNTNRAGV